MAKFIASAALFCALLVIIANASSATRTIITTIKTDEPYLDVRVSQRCRQEVQMHDMSSCENYIRMSRRSGSKSTESEFESEEEVLAMNGIENQQGTLRQCCNQLKQLRDDCQCEGIRSVVDQQVEQGMVSSPEEYGYMLGRASNLPAACGIRKSCRMRRD